MNFQYTSGKKFQDSAFQPGSFEQLKKDEHKMKILLHAFYLAVFLLLEFIILTLVKSF